ncbi:MAG: hypothetical protein ACPGUV_15070, partial [Polyangiales bacterium]
MHPGARLPGALVAAQLCTALLCLYACDDSEAASDPGLGGGEAEVLPAGAAHTGGTSRGRLLVADGAQDATALQLIDLDTAELLATLKVAGAARVYPSSDSRYGFAVQTSAGAVDAIEPGLLFIDHLDHFDLAQGDPAVIAPDRFAIRCPRPIHFTAHEGWAAAFCDGDGKAYVFSERSVSSTLRMLDIDSGRAHHGAALTALGHVLVTLPNDANPNDALPVGVKAHDFQGTETARFEGCPALHGEASTDTHACFGCSDGILCLSRQGAGTLAATKIDNPPGTPLDLRVGTLAAGKQGSHFVGNFGADALAFIDAQSGSLETLDIGQPVLKFAVTEDGSTLLALTADGQLHRIDIASRTITDSAALLPAFAVTPGHGQLRPTFALTYRRAYLVDPRNPAVLEFDLPDWALTGRNLSLPPGSYHSVAAV